MKQGNAMKIKLPVATLREGKSFVMYTPALELATCGTTQKQAETRFVEAVELFFEELEAMNTLDVTLRELGWNQVKKQWIAPQIVSHRTKSLVLGHAE